MTSADKMGGDPRTQLLGRSGSGLRLSTRQRDALGLLRRYERPQHDGWMLVREDGGSTCVIDAEVFVHGATAHALERRGLVELGCNMAGDELIRLTEEGFDVAPQ